MGHHHDDLLPLRVMLSLCALLIMTGHWGEETYPFLLPQTQHSIDTYFMIEGILAARLAMARDHSGWAILLGKLKSLYPLYAIGLIGGALTVLPLAQSGAEGWRPAVLAHAVLAGAVLVPFFPSAEVADGAVFPLNSPTWAISLELWAMALFLIFRERIGWRVPLTICLASAALITALSFHWHDFNMGWRVSSYAGGIPRAGFGFFGGVLMARILATGSPRLPRLPAPVIWGALILIVAFLKVRFIALPLLFGIGPCLVALGYVSTCPDWLRPAARNLANLAPAIYLLHHPVLAVFKAGGAGLGLSEAALASPLGYLIALLIVLAVAWVFAILTAPGRARSARPPV